MEKVATSLRGHHSGVSRAVEAHRQQVEDRQFRRMSKELSAMDATNKTSTQYLIPNQITDPNAQTEDTTAVAAEEEQQEDKYNAPMIEPVTSMSKSALAWSFQNSDPGKPAMSDPIPKGSFLDVKG